MHGCNDVLCSRVFISGENKTDVFKSSSLEQGYAQQAVIDTSQIVTGNQNYMIVGLGNVENGIAIIQRNQQAASTFNDQMIVCLRAFDLI